MGKRIPYLDSAKGFAIYLVVFAHLLAVTFNDWHEVCLYSPEQSSSVKQAGFLWQLVYAFHMPLFFMISGFLTYKSGGQILHEEIRKKCKRLLLPYLCTGGLLLPLYGTFGYWFLFALFELSLMAIFIQFTLDKVNKINNIVIDIVIIIIVCLISKKILMSHFLVNPICEPNRCVQFLIPFFMGFLLKKHRRLIELVSNHFTILFIAFILLFVMQYIDNPIVSKLHSMSVLYSVIGCVGTFASLSFFKMMDNASRLGRTLTYLGQNTMEIYILHVFFYIQIKSMGDFWLMTDVRTCITTQIIYGTFITCLNIGLALLTSKLIKKSKILNKLFFGF